MSTQLKKVTCSVRASVGDTRISIEDFIQLQVGDLLLLDTKPNQENTIFVRDKPTFKGLIGRHDRYRAVLITDVIDKETNDAV